MVEEREKAGARTSTSSVQVRSADELVYCEEEAVPRKAFQREGATRFVVADFRPGPSGRRTFNSDARRPMRWTGC